METPLKHSIITAVWYTFLYSSRQPVYKHSIQIVDKGIILPTKENKPSSNFSHTTGLLCGCGSQT